MFEGCRYFQHTNPVKSGYNGYILNEEGRIIGYVKLDGTIVDYQTEEKGKYHDKLFKQNQ